MTLQLEFNGLSDALFKVSEESSESRPRANGCHLISSMMRTASLCSSSWPACLCTQEEGVCLPSASVWNNPLVDDDDYDSMDQPQLEDNSVKALMV